MFSLFNPAANTVDAAQNGGDVPKAIALDAASLASEPVDVMVSGAQAGSEAGHAMNHWVNSGFDNRQEQLLKNAQINENTPTELRDFMEQNPTRYRFEHEE